MEPTQDTTRTPYCHPFSPPVVSRRGRCRGCIGIFLHRTGPHCKGNSGRVTARLVFGRVGQPDGATQHIIVYAVGCCCLRLTRTAGNICVPSLDHHSHTHIRLIPQCDAAATTHNSAAIVPRYGMCAVASALSTYLYDRRSKVLNLVGWHKWFFTTHT